MIRLGKLTDILTLGVVGVIGYLAYKFIKDPAGLGGLGKGVSDFFGGLFNLFPGGLFPGGIFHPVDQSQVEMATFGTSTDVRATWNLPTILPISPVELAKAEAIFALPPAPENLAAMGLASITRVMAQDTPYAAPSVAVAVERPIGPRPVPWDPIYYEAVYGRH